MGLLISSRSPIDAIGVLHDRTDPPMSSSESTRCPMAEFGVAAILWKKLTETNFKALKGEHRGEYDLRLGTDSRFRSFFSSLPQANPTSLGGYGACHSGRAVRRAISSQSDHDYVALHPGPNASRANDTYFKSQQPGSTYDLWSMGRAFPASASYPSVSNDRIAVIRDVRGRFHARWIPGANLSGLPSRSELR